MIYDTHCHPYLAEKKSQDEIIHNFSLTGDFLNCIGTNIKSSLKSIELSKKNSNVFATIGIHPCDILEEKDGKHEFIHLEDSLEKLEQMYLENKEDIVGIGEIGLDYHWLEDMAKKFLVTQIGEEKMNNMEEATCKEILTKIKANIKNYQKIFFKAQLMLAKKYDLPFVIHNRNSRDDIFEILKEVDYKNFIFHCYSENLEYAQKLLLLSPDCKISFSGIVTFNSAKEIQETAANIPLKNIIIETDSPYLTPTPLRGKEENEPKFVQYVLNKIIELRNEDPQIIEKQIFQNSLDMFGVNEKSI